MEERRASERDGSAWTPLRVGIFRSLWLAARIATSAPGCRPWGPQWLLVHQPHASLLVALVQTADTLPYVLFAYVGGVLADTFDWRLLLMGGDHSKGAEVGKQVQRYATQVKSVFIANAGHWLPEERPEEVAQHLLSFFAE